MNMNLILLYTSCGGGYSLVNVFETYLVSFCLNANWRISFNFVVYSMQCQMHARGSQYVHVHVTLNPLNESTRTYKNTTVINCVCL